jgi:cobyrinic acid a,c-diamide synthase
MEGWNRVMDVDLPRVTIAGERSGVGKTTITIGLLLALAERGLDPQPFKAGPDFLDPMHHSLLLSRSSRNLDTWMFPEAVEELFALAAQGSGISVIEGVMGLYDGVDGRSETGSTAHLSKMLRSPVILVVDAYGLSRSAGAVTLGFDRYDPDVEISGVIFNGVAGEKHLRMLEDSLVGVRSLGGIPREASISLESRHLGLILAEERPDRDRYNLIRALVKDHLDIDALVDIARSAPPIDVEPLIATEQEWEGKVRIGIAMDRAFNFYYQDNLDMLRLNGADLVFFSPLRDDMPDVDGLYFGGGYPELWGDQLESNTELRERIKVLSGDGMPIYAECGGMMYLCREMIDVSGERKGMTGIFDAKVRMTEGLEALGYVEVEVIRDTPISPTGGHTRGHVFHYSRIVESSETEYAYRLSGDRGIEHGYDGFIADNTLSSYTHLHFGACPGFATHFVRGCREYSRR